MMPLLWPQLYLVVPSVLRTLDVGDISAMERDVPGSLIQLQGLLSDTGTLTGGYQWVKIGARCPAAIARAPTQVPLVI